MHSNYRWASNVLADLEGYTKKSHLTELSQAFEKAFQVAASEISAQDAASAAYK